MEEDAAALAPSQIGRRYSMPCRVAVLVNRWRSGERECVCVRVCACVCVCVSKRCSVGLGGACPMNESWLRNPQRPPRSREAVSGRMWLDRGRAHHEDHPSTYLPRTEGQECYDSYLLSNP